MRPAAFVPVLAAALAASGCSEASLYQKACDGGDAAACNNLGVMYYDGAGVPQDYTRAASLYEQACDGGAE